MFQLINICTKSCSTFALDEFLNRLTELAEFKIVSVMHLGSDYDTIDGETTVYEILIELEKTIPQSLIDQALNFHNEDY